AVEVTGELASRHPVCLQDLVLADAGGVIVPHHRAVRRAADRVRPVEHDEILAGAGRGDHRLVHRPDVGVEPHTDVLDVEDDGVNPGLGVERLELGGVRTVGVVNGDAGPLVHVGLFGVAGLGGAAEAMLRTEDRADVHLAGGVHRVHDADQAVGDDAGRVGDDADPAAVEHPPVIGMGDVGTRLHPPVSTTSAAIGGLMGVGAAGPGGQVTAGYGRTRGYLLLRIGGIPWGSGL